jgi:hypothetical protein
MNAAVNNGEDEPPFEVVMRGMVQQYGLLRVLFGALRHMWPAARPPDAMSLSPHLRRDVGLPPGDGP